MICSVCNKNMPENSDFCPYCGTKVLRASSQTVYVDNEVINVSNSSKTTENLAIASLVCSILGITTCFSCFSILPILGLVFGIVVMNSKNIKPNSKNMAIAGIIIGSIGILSTFSIYFMPVAFQSIRFENQFTEILQEISELFRRIFLL